MKSSLTFAALAVVVLSAVPAHASSPYFTHVKTKGQTAKNGKWDIDYVQLTARPGHALTKQDLAINADLKSQAKGSICDADPSDDGQSAADSDSNSSTNVTFVSDRLLAITQSYDLYCAGAAHPEAGAASRLFDRSTGKEIDIRTGKEESYDAQPTAEQKKIDAVIAKALTAQAKIEKKQRGDRDCDDVYDADMSSVYSGDIELTPAALVVQNSVSHAEQVCQFAAKIPLAKFVGVASKGSLLDQLAQGSLKIKK